MMGYGRGLGYGYNMMGAGGWIAALIGLTFFLLLVAGFIALVIWAVRSAGGHGTPTHQSPPMSAPGHDEAMAIARRRYASGEITKEQFDELVRTLGG